MQRSDPHWNSTYPNIPRYTLSPSFMVTLITVHCLAIWTWRFCLCSGNSITTYLKCYSGCGTKTKKFYRGGPRFLCWSKYTGDVYKSNGFFPQLRRKWVKALTDKWEKFQEARQDRRLDSGYPTSNHLVVLTSLFYIEDWDGTPQRKSIFGA